MTVITPEELDAAWSHRHTQDVATLAGIATLHLDMCDLDSIDEDPANFLFLQRASWCIHKLELMRLMKKPGIEAYISGLKQTWDPRPLERGRFFSVTDAPPKQCGDPLVHTGHVWHEIVEDNKAEMRWCRGNSG